MSNQTSGPDPADWPTAIFRGLHPARWAVCLIGLAATWLTASVTQSLFDGLAPRWAEWWDDPTGQARELAGQIAERSPAAIIVRLGPALAVASAIWCLVGAWVARHEILARVRDRPGSAGPPLGPAPTAVVRQKFKDLVVACPTVLVLAGIALLPLAIAGWVNLIGGVGAVLVAVLLPVVLVADFFAVLLLLGAIAWPLMPVTIAAESSDVFDALSRAYNYAYARPARLILLSAAAWILAALPLLGGVYLIDGPLAALPAAARQATLWLAASLTASVFWSLQTLVYLHLRAAMDDVDANQIEGVPSGDTSETPIGSGEVTTKPAPVSQIGLSMQMIPLVLLTWCLTVWLFGRSGDDAGWMAWGLADGFVPPAQGLYRLASVVAAAWGLAWVAIPILIVFRQVRPRVSTAGEPAASGDAK